MAAGAIAQFEWTSSDRAVPFSAYPAGSAHRNRISSNANPTSFLRCYIFVNQLPVVEVKRFKFLVEAGHAEGLVTWKSAKCLPWCKRME